MLRVLAGCHGDVTCVSFSWYVPAGTHCAPANVPLVPPQPGTPPISVIGGLQAAFTDLQQTFVSEQRAGSVRGREQGLLKALGATFHIVCVEPGPQSASHNGQTGLGLPFGSRTEKVGGETELREGGCPRSGPACKEAFQEAGLGGFGCFVRRCGRGKVTLPWVG